MRNLIRGDDAAGPVLVRQLADRALPDGVRLIDGGTAGWMSPSLRGARRAIVVDASRVGVPAGTIHKVPGGTDRSETAGGQSAPVPLGPGAGVRAMAAEGRISAGR